MALLYAFCGRTIVKQECLFHNGSSPIGHSRLVLYESPRKLLKLMLDIGQVFDHEIGHTAQTSLYQLSSSLEAIVLMTNKCFMHVNINTRTYNVHHV